MVDKKTDANDAKSIDKKDTVLIPEYNHNEYSWCKHEEKVVYNPTKKRHCPYCRKLL